MTQSLTNIRLIPSFETVTSLVKLLEQNKAPYNDLIEDPHCTIVFSRDIVDINTITLPEIKYPIVGINPKFEIFETKDNGLCLMVVFDCKVAEALFLQIKQKHNLRTLFDNYMSHITIKKNIEVKNLNLPAVGFDLYFDKLKMDNGE